MAGTKETINPFSMSVNHATVVDQLSKNTQYMMKKKPTLKR